MQMEPAQASIKKTELTSNYCSHFDRVNNQWMFELIPFALSYEYHATILVPLQTIFGENKLFPFFLTS